MVAALNHARGQFRARVGNERDATPGEPPTKTGCDTAQKSSSLSAWWIASFALAMLGLRSWRRKEMRA